MRRPQVNAPAYQDTLIPMSSVAAGASQRMLSPKRPRVETAGLADVFPYYAGFSFEWACSHLAAEVKGRPAVVLDPWNGSGTTTFAAQALGLRSIGVDLNPVASLVAQLRVEVRSSAELAAAPPTPRTAPKSDVQEPLLAWFEYETAIRIRQWKTNLDQLPRSSAVLGLVALFRVVRRITGRFEGSNPTWVRRSSPDLPAIGMDRTALDNAILDEQAELVDRLRSESYGAAPTAILTASANALPIASKSIDVVLTSPPYLTRIDYAVAYSRELAILGVDISRDRTLRSGLMGTTLIRPGKPGSGIPYGSLATNLVTKVQSHPSKASAGYYLKQIKQYLDDLTVGIEEISRVSKPNAVMILVVQDSYYKDIPIPLAKICIEEAAIRGWQLIDSEPFEVSRTLTQLNTAARAYAKGQVAETVITLRRD